jgi:hypothetical protein
MSGSRAGGCQPAGRRQHVGPGEHRDHEAHDKYPAPQRAVIRPVILGRMRSGTDASVTEYRAYFHAGPDFPLRFPALIIRR